MLNIPSEIKELYKQDGTPKILEIYLPELSLTIPRSKIVGESLRLNEGICPNEDIKIGLCTSCEVSLVVADVEQQLEGKTMVLSQTVGGYTVPLGTYIITSETRQSNLRYKELVAYDSMQNINIDVAAWYNGLTFPLTLAAFRSSLLSYLGMTEDTGNLPLPNDSMLVEKTILPALLPGRELIEKVEELNGVFGVINPEGKFSHVILKPAYGDYPTNDYPQNDYPISANDTSYVQPDLIDEVITAPMRETIRFEEYIVPEIDKLIIRGEEDDIGAIVGTGTNAYVIEGNYLVYGKSAAQLQAIATNVFGFVAKRPYRSYESSNKGLPYLKPGDMVKFDRTEPVIGYILNRSLKGSKALMDRYTAPGERERKQNTSQNVEITKLKYRVAKLKVDIDGVLIELNDIAEEVTTSLSIMHGEIELKVDKSGVIGSINLTHETATIKASKINFNGFATFDVNGNLTTIDGSVLKTGTVIADSVRSNWVYTGYLSADQIVGGTITGVVFVSTDGSRTTRIANGGITSGYASVSFLEVPTQINVGSSIQMTASDGSITCNKLNGGYPITDATISYQSVLYASVAGTVQSIPSLYTNQIYASDTGYGNIDFLGFDNAAGVNWVQANFQPKTPSDIRLKYDIQPMNDIPDELFYSLKPYQFRYKTDQYGNKKYFGIIAQQLENAFAAYGLNPIDYDLFEIKNVKAYTDDGYFIKKETHRINYYNLFGWMIKIMKNQNTRITNQDARIAELENIIKSLT